MDFPGPTSSVRQRVDWLKKRLGLDSDTALASYCGFANPQRITNWIGRGKVPAEAALQIQGKTGMSAVYLRAGVGEPGDIRVPQAAEAAGLDELRGLVFLLAETVSEKLPGVGDALRARLRGPDWADLRDAAALLDVLEKGRRSKAARQ